LAYKAFDLTGKVTLITGGSRGIGLGMAEALVMAGSEVVIWGADPSHFEHAKEVLAPYSKKIMCQTVDVTHEHDVIAGLADVLKKYGKIDTAIAAAGIVGMPTPFEETDTNAFKEVLDVNLTGSFWTFREVCRHMVERAKNGNPGGSIIGISSIVTMFGAPNIQAYAASKGAIIPLIKSIAIEYARYGIRANTVVPGWIATDMTRRFQESKKFAEKFMPRIPARRWGTPEDLGGIAVYLASDASRYHTGDTFVIDGGYSIY
jgi:NAD(P)-dependent dehydrogenase (short-subunit alcohol dehydrogenase family)